MYRQILGFKPSDVEVKCLEYDEKFKMFGDNFIFYDFNKPLNLDSSLKHHFDVVIADPPFLSEECLTQTAMTIKYLAKDKIILCTGEDMYTFPSISMWLKTRSFYAQVCIFFPSPLAKPPSHFPVFVGSFHVSSTMKKVPIPHLSLQLALWG